MQETWSYTTTNNSQFIDIDIDGNRFASVDLFGAVDDETTEQEYVDKANFLVNACNSHYDLLEALKDISAMCEKGLLSYANSKTNAESFKTLAGWVTEKSKAAIAKATKQ